MRSLLAVRLGRDPHVIGRLYFTEKVDGAEFTDDDERIAARFAALAARAVRSAELLGEERDSGALFRLQAVRQTALLELNRHATAGESLDGLIGRAAELVSRTLTVDLVLVVGVLPGSRRLEVRAAIGWRRNVLGRVLDAHSVPGQAIRSTSPVVTTDLAGEPGARGRPALLFGRMVRSAAAVPIGDPGGPVGALAAFRRERHVLLPADLGFMEAIATVLATARERERREQHRARRDILLDRLTSREAEILKLMAQGLASRTIAAQLMISYMTVRSHVQSVISKLDAHSKLEAVAHAAEYGLLGDAGPPPPHTGSAALRLEVDPGASRMRVAPARSLRATSSF